MARRGFILVEATVVYVILGLALVALMPMFIMAVRAGTMAQEMAAGTELAAELLEEVRMRRWDAGSPGSGPSPTRSSALGPDAGENPRDKSTFDDVDDFAGFSESPPADPLGAPLTAFPGYSRTVSVRYVDEGLAPSAVPTDYKQVTACVSAARMKPLCLDTVLTNH